MSPRPAIIDRVISRFEQLPLTALGARGQIFNLLGWEEVDAPGPDLIGSSRVFATDRGPVGLQDRLSFFILEIEGDDPATGMAGQWYKAVFPTVLEYLPRQMRDQTTVLDRFAKILKGFYNARVDLIGMVAGMFGETPGTRPLGLVQSYATQGVGQTLEEAVQRGSEAFVALRANLCTIPQARFVPMRDEEREFFALAMMDFEYMLVGIGQPDPRQQGTRAIGERFPGKDPGEETLEQNEIMYRGLQAAGIDFANLTLATAVPREDIFRLEERMREEASLWASMVQGNKGWAMNFAIPTIFSGMDSHGASSSYEAGRSHVLTEGTAHSESTGVADGYTHGAAHSVSTSVVDTRGTTHTEGESHGSMASSGGSRTESTGTAEATGEAHTVGSADSVGTEHSVSRSSTSGGSSSVSTTTGETVTDSHTQINTETAGRSENHSVSKGAQEGSNWGVAATTQQGASHGVQRAETEGGSFTESRGYSVSQGAAGTVTAGGGVVPGSASVTVSASESASMGQAASTSRQTSAGETDTTSHSVGLTGSVGGSSGETLGQTDSRGRSEGVTTGTNVTHSESTIVNQQTVSSSSMASSSRGETFGESKGHTDSRSETTSAQHTASAGVAIASVWASGVTHQRTVADAVSESQAVGRSEGITTSESWSRTTSSGKSDTTSTGIAEGTSAGASQGLTVARATGLSTGLSAGVSVQKSYLWNDLKAAKVAELLQRQVLLLDKMGREGAFLTQNFWFFRSAAGARAGAGLYVTAFHGETDHVVTPATTRQLDRDEAAAVRRRLRCFAPTTRRETAMGVFETTRDGNLLPMLHAAALLSPALYEGGRAVTVKEAIPPYAIYGGGIAAGDVELGDFISFETGTTVGISYAMGRDRMGHWGIFGDSGYGKSEATMYLVAEMNAKWGLPAIIFDWGLNYRKLLRAVPRERFIFHALYPSGPRPLRWNPLQFIADSEPEAQMAMTIDVLCNAGNLGERQKGFLHDTLRNLYLDRGALTFDQDQLDPTPSPPPGVKPTQHAARRAKAVLTPAEIAALQTAGLSVPAPVGGQVQLSDCADQTRRQLAAMRSREVDFTRWYEALHLMMQEKEARKQTRDVDALQGILNRMSGLAYGRLAAMYGALGPHEAPMDITRVMLPPTPDDPGRIVVLEGGTMGETEKAILFGLMIAQIYEAAGVRHRWSRGSAAGVQNFLLVIEEANKVVVSPGAQDKSATASTSQLFSGLARDSRGRGVYVVWSGQSPSAFPPEIVSSCTNILVFRLKIGPDRQLVTETMGKISAGLVSPEYIMHVSRLPIANAVVVLGRTTDEVLVEPSLIQTRMISGQEPSDGELTGLAAVPALAQAAAATA